MKALIAGLFAAWLVVVAVKTIRGARWDREQAKLTEIRQGIMQRESTMLSDQGWHRDSTTGMWTP